MIMEAKISVSEEDKTNTFRSGTTSVNETCHMVGGVMMPEVVVVAKAKVEEVVVMKYG